MALTLTDALAAPTTLAPAIRLTITGTVPDAIEAGYLFRLEDEVLELKYFGKTEETILGGAATQTVDDRNVWYARRGVDNTAIVSHIATTAVKGVADALLAGTTEVVPAPPFGAAGGTSDHTALTNLDTADQHPIAAVEGLEAALAAAEVVVTATRNVGSDITEDDATVLGDFQTADVDSLISGTGIPAGATILSVVVGVSAEISEAATETLPGGYVRVTEPDPGAIGANRFWRRGEESEAAFAIRNAADNNWAYLGPVYYDSNGALHSSVAVSGDNLVVTRWSLGGAALSEVVVGSVLLLRQSDAAGNVVGQVAFDEYGGVAVTGPAFTWNGDQLVAVGTDILPATDNTHDLGSAELRWATANVAVEVNVGDTITGAYAQLIPSKLELHNEVQFTEYARDHIELQDDLGDTAFEVDLGPELRIMAPGLPTADPVSVGQLWNDGGTLKVSAGA